MRLPSNNNPIIVGRCGKAYGVHGWIKINSFTSPPVNILNFSQWFLEHNGQLQEINIEDRRELGNGTLIVKFQGCESPEVAAKNFTNLSIAVMREQLPKLPQNDYYWHDLVGLQVQNTAGINLGTIKELFATGANDVMVVVGTRKHLIPYTSNVIIKVDLATKMLLVDWDENF